jgi:hypothetical protein
VRLETQIKLLPEPPTQGNGCFASEVAAETVERTKWLSRLFSCVTADKVRNCYSSSGRRPENIFPLSTHSSSCSTLSYSLLLNPLKPSGYYMYHMI